MRNQDIFRKFYDQLFALKNELSIQHSDIMQSILRIPNVIAVENDQLSEDEWEVLQIVIKDAIKKLNISRKMEGEILAKDMRARIQEFGNLSKSNQGKEWLCRMN